MEYINFRKIFAKTFSQQTLPVFSTLLLQLFVSLVFKDTMFHQLTCLIVIVAYSIVQYSLKKVARSFENMKIVFLI